MASSGGRLRSTSPTYGVPATATRMSVGSVGGISPARPVGSSERLPPGETPSRSLEVPAADPVADAMAARECTLPINSSKTSQLISSASLRGIQPLRPLRKGVGAPLASVSVSATRPRSPTSTTASSELEHDVTPSPVAEYSPVDAAHTFAPQIQSAVPGRMRSDSTTSSPRRQVSVSSSSPRREQSSPTHMLLSNRKEQSSPRREITSPRREASSTLLSAAVVSRPSLGHGRPSRDISGRPVPPGFRGVGVITADGMLPFSAGSAAVSAAYPGTTSPSLQRAPQWSEIRALSSDSIQRLTGATPPTRSLSPGASFVNGAPPPRVLSPSMRTSTGGPEAWRSDRRGPLVHSKSYELSDRRREPSPPMAVPHGSAILHKAHSHAANGHPVAATTMSQSADAQKAAGYRFPGSASVQYAQASAEASPRKQSQSGELVVRDASPERSMKKKDFSELSATCKRLQHKLSVFNFGMDSAGTVHL